MANTFLAMAFPLRKMEAMPIDAHVFVCTCAHLSSFSVKIFFSGPLLSHSKGMDPAAKNKML